jgi:hypothetical protein
VQDNGRRNIKIGQDKCIDIDPLSKDLMLQLRTLKKVLIVCLVSVVKDQKMAHRD